MSETGPSRTAEAGIAELVLGEELPDAFAIQARDHLGPVADRIAQARWSTGHILQVGVAGPQGSGKSTIAAALRVLLDRSHRLRPVVLSLDDLYLTRAKREALAREVHPLLLTRGPPGTHDIKLGVELMARLEHAAPDELTWLPAFDKATDTRRPAKDWLAFRGRPDVILFEGWCVGAQPETNEARLLAPINALEAEEDPDAAWRRHVNDALSGAYRALFDPLDLLVWLQPPSFEQVFEWRALQERKLRARLERESGPAGSALLDEPALRRFIAHYERITRRMMAEAPARADILIRLDENHAISGIEMRG